MFCHIKAKVTLKTNTINSIAFSFLKNKNAVNGIFKQTQHDIEDEVTFFCLFFSSSISSSSFAFRSLQNVPIN